MCLKTDSVLERSYCMSALKTLSQRTFGCSCKKHIQYEQTSVTHFGGNSDRTLFLNNLGLKQTKICDRCQLDEETIIWYVDAHLYQADVTKCLRIVSWIPRNFNN